MSKKISELTSIGKPAKADEIAVNKAGVSKKVTIGEITDGADDTVEGLFGKPFRNPHKYILLFEDFNIAPENAVGIKSGWAISGANVAAGNIGLPLRGLGTLASTIEMLTAGASGDEAILKPVSRLGAAIGTWNARIQHLETEFFLGVRLGVSSGASNTSSTDLYFGWAEADAMSVTQPGAPCFIRANSGNFRFRWGKTSPGYVADVDMGIGWTTGEGNTDLFAHYLNGKLRLYTNSVLVKTVTIANETGFITSDLAVMIGIKANVASIRGIEVDYLLCASNRNQTLNSPASLP